VTLDPAGGTYDAGTVVTLTAEPALHHHFVEWTGDLTGSVNPTTLTMDGDKTVTANFALDTYTLTYTAGAGGTISGTTPQTVAYGGSGTEVTAVPDAGYAFASWSDGVLTASRTDANVTANISVTASFAALAVQNTDTGLYYATISAAIADPLTLDTHTIQVGAGVFEEQVVVTKALTITGAGCGNTVIKSPVTLTQTFTATQGTMHPIVFVNGVNATVQNLTIDGAGRGNTNAQFLALSFYNGGGKAADLCIVGMEDTPLSTANHGVGVHAYNNTGGPYALEVDNVAVTDFQKNGMTLEGAGLTVNVHDCTVTGRGYTAAGPGQNGVQVSRGAVGTVTRCKVTEVGYDNPYYQSSGVMVYSTPGPVTVSDCKGANKFVNAQVPVYAYNANGVVDGIEVTGSVTAMGVCGVNSNASALMSVAGEPPAGSHIGRKPAPDGGMEDAGLSATASPNGTLATSYTLSVANSCLYGSDVAGSEGISADSYGGGMDVTATNNTLQDWDYALHLWYAPATLTAHENSISSSVTAGFASYDAGNPTQNVERNWWGDAAGPAGAGDDVSGADYDPWIHSGTNLATCAFDPPTYSIVATAASPHQLRSTFWVGLPAS
jgi:hypothetical protein